MNHLQRLFILVSFPLLALPAHPDAPISRDYPGDRGIIEHPAVLFHSDFEQGMEGWSRHTSDTERLAVISAPDLAISGSHVLRARITDTDLEQRPNLSTFAEFRLPTPVDTLYWRFYARLDGDTAPPHHWTRTFAEHPEHPGRSPAGTRPAGNEGFSVGLDLHTSGELSLYNYWHDMRSWVCNDGSLDHNCEGRQGGAQPDNPHYGNIFNPADQKPLPRDEWVCIEQAIIANTPGQYDGAVALWVNDELIGEYRTGTPRGRWLRDKFHTHGRYYRDREAFEGFNFRTDPNVQLARVSLDLYYQRSTLDRLVRRGHKVTDQQLVWYDAIVIGTERIGCQSNQ